MREVPGEYPYSLVRPSGLAGWAGRIGGSSGASRPIPFSRAGIERCLNELGIDPYHFDFGDESDD